MADPLFLPEVQNALHGPSGDRVRKMEAAGVEVPPIQRLLAYKPSMSEHLNRFTEAVMRGLSPLHPGIRELIAAFTSRENQCVF